jgi:hypothetical protein
MRQTQYVRRLSHVGVSHSGTFGLGDTQVLGSCVRAVVIAG